MDLFDYITVNLSKEYSGETLERVCVKAAEEMGYKARPEDEYRREYMRDPFLKRVEEQEVYFRTDIRVGNFFPRFVVKNINKKGKIGQDYFSIWFGILKGISSQKEIQKYINNVCKELDELDLNKENEERRAKIRENFLELKRGSASIPKI